MCEDKLYDVLLPEKVRGRYWIEDTELELTDIKRKLISIEGEAEVWKIKAGRGLKLYMPDTDRETSMLELEVGKIYPIILQKQRGYIFTESYTQDRCTFNKYCIDSNRTINIGTQSDNQIRINNPYVSPIHAQISLANDTWTLIDNNSKNGIYVNGKRVTKPVSLDYGDILYILGVKIVFGYHFLAINNPDQTVIIDDRIFKPYQSETIVPYIEPDEIEEKIYYRSPHFNREIEPLMLKIDAPTAQEK